MKIPRIVLEAVADIILVAFYLALFGPLSVLYAVSVGDEYVDRNEARGRVFVLTLLWWVGIFGLIIALDGGSVFTFVWEGS